MAEVIVRADRLVTADGERAGALRIASGRIVELAETIESRPGDHVVEVPAPLVLMPGLVDTHVHVNEPGRTEWEGFATATAAAAAGGVTTIVDMPLNSIPPTVDVAALQLKQAAAAGQLSIDVAFWAGAVPGNMADLAGLHDAGVVGFKCFLLPSGVAEFGHLDERGLREVMTEIASFGGLLIAHAEDDALIADLRPGPGNRAYRTFLQSRPDAAEESAIGRLLAATAATGCRTHLVHLSSAAALAAIAEARQAGLPLTVETCPHYLALAAEEVPDGATQFKCCPPIRDGENADRLWQGLADGLIDLVVSDHSPATAELKHLDDGDFAAAWGGISSVQLSLAVMWTEAARRGHTLPELARWMSREPARLAGLAGKGELALGFDADFSVFDPDAEFVVDPATLKHRNPATPYAGTRLRGVVTETWLRGEPIAPGARPGRMLVRGGRR